MILFDYELDKYSNVPIYEQLYEKLRTDIISGEIKGFMRLPSKRQLADNLGISKVTVENAYSLLQSEGYIYSVEKKGYYAENNLKINIVKAEPIPEDEPVPDYIRADLVANNVPSDLFPFTVWTRLMREAVLNYDKELLDPIPYNGSYCLRKSLCQYLHISRGMNVKPSQVVIGAGTSYLYALIIQLLGTERVYALENPCYRRIKDIYESYGAVLNYVPFDDEGISVDKLAESSADILHISPAHNFPTGIVTSPKRRNELLGWVNSKPGRYIIEDEFDSEFKFTGKPIPAMQSLDSNGKIIYINTFSKTISPSVRISYMILPDSLAEIFHQKLSFYSCTVSSFEQYTLASFIDNGYFDRHINRMRKYYKNLKKDLLECVENSDISQYISIIENDCGLFFLLKIDTEMEDTEIRNALNNRSIRVSFLSDYYRTGDKYLPHILLVNFSGLNRTTFGEFLNELSTILKG